MKAWSQFEKMIEQTNEWYCRNRKGTVAKIPNGTKTIRVGEKPVVIPTNKTGCDFIGHLKGRPIAFDCKSTENKTAFPFYVGNKPMLKDHQKNFLKDFKLSGGTAFLLIQFNKSHQVFLVDVDDYLNMQKNLGRKSIPLDYLKEFEVRQHGYYSHYLEKLEQNYWQ
ncbi:Holliday junction resolvase RecU [Enterococcus faecalis]|uniref:Holliday junction resolvase RecU n=1 Tax=Enterococcus faecalis TaxID=1351 RepID=UPI0035DD25B3